VKFEVILFPSPVTLRVSHFPLAFFAFQKPLHPVNSARASVGQFLTSNFLLQTFIHLSGGAEKEKGS